MLADDVRGALKWVVAVANGFADLLGLSSGLGKAQVGTNFKSAPHALTVADVEGPRACAAGQDANSKSRHVAIGQLNRLGSRLNGS